jgi:hypothetical protein
MPNLVTSQYADLGKQGDMKLTYRRRQLQRQAARR